MSEPAEISEENSAEEYGSPAASGDQDPYANHGGGEEPWLVSYADLMTLLFGFFAMLFTFASFTDQSDDFVKVRKDIAKYFGATHINAPEKLSGEVKSELKKIPILKEMIVTPREHEVEISLLTSALFESGKATLLPGSEEPLKKLAELILSNGKDTQVWVEGHCDDNPSSSPIFPTNWELSAARASAVVRVLEKNGIPGEHLGAMGYGDTRPALPNRDTAGRPIPDNQVLNRRVVLKVSFPKQEPIERPAIPSQ